MPPGVDLHTFHPCDQPKSRAQFGVAQDAQVILFVGRIQPLKAPDVLIKAVAELVQRDPERRDRLRLIIIGSPSGPDAAWSQDTRPVGRLISGSPTWWTSGRTPPGPSCSAGTASPTSSAVPSYNESFGLVALEAQACGRPVVATDVGGLRHAVDDGTAVCWCTVTTSASGPTRSARSLDDPARCSGWAPTQRSMRRPSAGTTRPPPRCRRTARLTCLPARRQTRRPPATTWHVGAGLASPAASSAVSGLAMSSSDWLSALTPKIASTIPPMIIRAAPMK